jgi:hypothetical protein
MDWFKGKSTGNHRFSYEIWGVAVIVPFNQSIGGIYPSTTLTFLVQCHQTPQGYLWEEEWPALSSCPVAHAFTASEVSRIRESRGESLVMLHKLGSGFI